MAAPFVTINGTNYSPAFVSVTGSYTGNSLSGIYMITGELILSCHEGGSGPLTVNWDDRYNPDFQRGKEVFIGLDPTTPHNIVGNTYVLSARYKRNEGIVKITLGCILALLNSRTPQDLAICVTADQGVSTQEAVILLLNAAGITSNLSITITNGQKLLEPLLLGESQGLINTAAQMAAASGYFLWQDKTGKVLTQTMVPTQTSDGRNLLFKSRADVERLNETELPYTKIIVRGAKREMVELSAQEEISKSEEFLFNNTNVKTVKVFRDFANRTITTITEQKIGVLTDITTVVEEYETIPNIGALNNQVASPSECIPPDEGRLVTRTTTLNQDFIRVFGACAEVWQESAKIVEENSDPPKQALFYSGGTWNSSIVTENWIYNISPAVIEDSKTTILTFGDNENNDNFPIAPTPGSSTTIGISNDANAGSSKDNVFYEKITQERKGTAAPITCHWTLGNNELLAEFADTVLPPGGWENLTITEVDTTEWNKNKDNQWYGERTVERSNVKVDPNRYTSAALAADDLIEAAQAQNGMFSRKTVLRETRNDWTPPDPGRFPPRYTIDETDYERIFIISGFGSSQEERIKVVNLDIFGNVDQTTQKVGTAHGLQSWGKNKGSRITSNFYQFEMPMQSIDLYEDTIDSSKIANNLESFYIDNPSIAITRDNMAASGVALFISADRIGVLAPDVLFSATNVPAYFDSETGDYCTYTYTPVSIDLTDSRYQFDGFGFNGELGNEEFYTDLDTGKRIISEPVSGAILEETIEIVSSFTSVSSIPRGDFFINENGELVDSSKNSLIPPFAPVVGAIVTKGNQTGSCKTTFTTAQVTETLLCTKYMYTPTFQVFYPATHIAENCTRELGTEFNSEIAVLGDQELIPLIDLETNGMIALTC